MGVTTMSESAFALLRSAFSADAPTLTFSNPTIASVAALQQNTRRAPSRGDDATIPPTIEIEADFLVLPSAVTVANLHPGYTTFSDGTYTWRLRDEPQSAEGYLLRLVAWRAADFKEA